MQDLKKRSDIHWSRKIWHMSGVSLMALIYASVPEHVAWLALAIVWGLSVPLDVIRQFKPSFNLKAMRVFGPLMREYEKDGLAGTTYLLTGVAIVTFLFPRDIVLLTLFFLAFADPIASIVGIKFGRTKVFGHKSLQGSLAAFFVCTLVTLIYLSWHEILLTHLWIVSLLSGLLGAGAELLPVARLDDNLTLPLLSAFGLFGIFSAFGYPVAMNLGGIF